MISNPDPSGQDAGPPGAGHAGLGGLDPGSSAPDQHDLARAETLLPLSPAELLAFVADSERLFRLNPHLEIEGWQPWTSGGNRAGRGGGTPALDRVGLDLSSSSIGHHGWPSPSPDSALAGFDLTLTNEINGQRLRTAVAVTELPAGRIFTYAVGLKQATSLRVEAAGTGSRLIFIDQYPRIEDPQDPRVAEVDPSLVPWVAAIRRHLLARRRWGWLPGWCWWHEVFALGMPPRQRRLVRLILWVGFFEFLVFLALVLVLV